MNGPYRFFTALRVRFNETDLQGHVNFAWYLNYFDVAITDYLRNLGYSYQQMSDDGLDMLYVDAHASYRSSAHFDETLRVHCRLGHIGNSSMRFDFQVYSDADERLVATGEITVVMVEADTRQKVIVPDHLRQSVALYESGRTEE